MEDPTHKLVNGSTVIEVKIPHGLINVEEEKCN